TGVLNRLDSDAEAARALNIPAVLAQPFSPVASDAIAQALKMVGDADAVILSQVPFGSGNLVNLTLAEAALNSGKPVFLADGIATRDYTEGKAAQKHAMQLAAQGARFWRTIPELLAMMMQIVYYENKEH
ncbi:MAG: hypothetical protein WCG93_17000, partial [Paludibacter sp.]